VYEYQITQYSRETNEGGLFVDIINTFLKIKAEASGYPSGIRSLEEVDLFIPLRRVQELNCTRLRSSITQQNEVWPNSA